MYEDEGYDGYDEQAAADEAAYQAMCDGDAEAEKMAMEAEAEAEAVKAQLQEVIDQQTKEAHDKELEQMNEALEKGTLVKDPYSKVTPEELHESIEREKILMREKCDRRCEQCSHGKKQSQ